jgi:uncharacterized membrane protein
MKIVEQSIIVNQSLSVVYDQWTQFEDFPQFMEGVKTVRQLDEKNLHWEADIGGKFETWDAEIFEQIPDKRIAWRSISGAQNSGVVNFDPISVRETKVTVSLSYEPQGAMENLGSALGVVNARVRGDLKRFKTFIEARGTPTGAWRGEIHGREVQLPSST